jgi:translocation and assembly module TamA
MLDSTYEERFSKGIEMYNSQRLLLTLLACLYSTTPFAQANVDVKISGINKLLEDNVRSFLSIEQQKDHALVNEGRLHRLHKKASQEISNALQPFGYYRAEIKANLTQPTPNQWQATYTINPGPPLPIGQFNFSVSEEMSKDPEFKILIQKFSLRKGKTFNHLDYENFKASLSKLAAERGYFNATFTEHRVEIDLDAYEARINLRYDGGSRYHFGEVLLNQDVLKQEFLQRYIPFKKGSPYTLSEVIDLQQALNDSDYFQTVEVSPGQPQPDSTEIPITVTLTPRKPNRYSIGLGYGTDTGARAKFGWEKPRLNRSGHRFNSEAKVAEIGYSLSAHYRVPVLNPRTDQMVYSAGIVKEETDASESTVRTVGASLNRNRKSWRESLSINYQKEEYVIADDRGTSTLLIPGVNWSRIWGRKLIYTLEGLRFNISMRGASKSLVSDTNFFQLQGGIKAIHPFGRRGRIIANGKLGSTWTEEFYQLPSSVRFFAGGSQSVRGYSYNSLGPEDNNGDVVGGRHLMVGSIEYEHNFGNKWGVALFYDAGNAIDDIDEKLERGAGFGFRWQSPIGPVRIDLASAISRDNRPWRLHITIGPDL